MRWVAVGVMRAIGSWYVELVAHQEPGKEVLHQILRFRRIATPEANERV